MSILLACAACGCIVAIVVYYSNGLRQPRGGVVRDYDGLKSVEVLALYRDSLPRDGRNFCYFAAVHPPYVNVSFEISEERFREWTSEQGWNVHETNIHNEKETSSFVMETPDGEFMTIRPEDGWIYCTSTLRGNMVEASTGVAYDRRNGKAYYRHTN
ncbi:MAG: hypothetical protein NTW96_15525 [Planctomycetia bacterium]|nr:hypothetical protein [Planctomycetia bacterium]